MLLLSQFYFQFFSFTILYSFPVHFPEAKGSSSKFSARSTAFFIFCTILFLVFQTQYHLILTVTRWHFFFFILLLSTSNKINVLPFSQGANFNLFLLLPGYASSRPVFILLVPLSVDVSVCFFPNFFFNLSAHTLLLGQFYLQSFLFYNIFLPFQFIFRCKKFLFRISR